MKIPALSARTVPWALLLACLISFGPLIPWLGFYWDDWPTVWYLHTLGPSGFGAVFASDRPLLGSIFMVTARLVGESTLGWQLFGILTRWLACLALWWTLRSVWPNQTRLVTIVTLLYAVYPGFKQQFIAVTYSADWIAQALFFLSLGLMVWAARRRNLFWPLSVLSWALAAFVLFADEYYFGLELLRPVFLWIVLASAAAGVRTNGSHSAGTWPGGPWQDWLRAARQLGPRLAPRILAQWAPYVVIMAVFLFWRLVLHESPRGEVQIFDQVRSNPFLAALDLLWTVLTDVAQSGLLAWFQALNPAALLELPRLFLPVFAALILLAFALTTLYLSRLNTPADSVPHSPTPPLSHSPSLSFLLIGIFALFTGGLPFWVTRLPIEFYFPWDRFNLAMMVGSSFLVAGLVGLVSKKRGVQAVLLGVLVGLAVGMHFQDANRFREDWKAQREFFWQLTWRAPGLQPGTMLLTAELPFTYFSDNSLSAPLNWTYAPHHTGMQMPYLLADIQSRLGLQLAGLEAGLPVYQPYRATYFTGSTSQVVAVYLPPEGCLKVFDPALDGFYPLRQEILESAKLLSDTDLLLADASQPARPPEHLLGPEPEPDWCYYFQQAELARQQGDWEAVAALGQTALQSPPPRGTREGQLAYATELAPYIEGYARLGDWDEAGRLTLEGFQTSRRARGYLCATWRRLAAETPAGPRLSENLEQVRDTLACEGL